MIDVMLDGLARSTLALSLSAGVALLLLAASRPRASRIQQLTWFIVLLQAFCWRPFGLPLLPPSSPSSESTASPSTAAEFPSPLVGEGLGVRGAVPPDASDVSLFSDSPSALLTPQPQPTAARNIVSSSISPRSSTLSWKPALAFAWLLGLSSVLLIGLIDYFRLLRRLARERSPAPAAWLDDWNALPHGRALLVATETLGPLAIGTPFQSVVAAPRALLDSLSPTQRRAVFAHELAHLRHGDPFWMLIAWLATALQWFNPLAWFVARRFHAAAELACDARLPDDARLPLAHVLLNLGAPARRPALAMTGGALAARIRALATPRPQEPRWKTAMIATLVLAAACTGWIRLEAAPAPQLSKEPPLPSDRPKTESKPYKLDPDNPAAVIQPPETKVKKRIGVKKAIGKATDEPLPQAIKRMEAQLKQKEQEKLAARQAAHDVLKAREDTVADFKAREKSIGSDEKLRIEKSVIAMGDQGEQLQKTFQRIAGEYDQLKRSLERDKADLAQQQRKLETLWVRGLLNSTIAEDDALALERTLAYLALREPKFGSNEILPYQEHVETEAVHKLEALLKRGLKPNPGESQRQALERILQTPPTPDRQRFAEMRANMKKLECPVAFWDDQRDKWLDFAAEFLTSMWPLKPVESTSERWFDACVQIADFRAKPRPEKGGNGFFLDAFNRISEPFLPRTILLAETACITNAQHCPETWASLRQQLAAPQTKRYGDLRSAPIVIDRLFALLTAAKASTVYAKAADDLRQLLEDNLPARALDQIMEREGKNRIARIRHFRERKVSVNFQGRGFANAFEELTNKAAVPLIVTETSWRSKLTPVTLHAEARWIDVLKEIINQGHLMVTEIDPIVIIHGFDNQSAWRLRDALRRAVPQRHRPTDPSPPYPSPKLMEALAAPLTAEFSETPLSQGLQFLEVQAKVPLVLFLPRTVDADTPETVEAHDVPLSVALELLMTPLRMTWIPIYDAVLLAPAALKGDLEAKAVPFRDQRKAVETAASTGDPSAKALMSATVADMSGTPLDQALQFFKGQNPGLQLETRVANKELHVTISVSGVSLAETLALLAWKHNLKLTFEGSKAVLSDN